MNDHAIGSQLGHDPGAVAGAHSSGGGSDVGTLIAAEVTTDVDLGDDSAGGEFESGSAHDISAADDDIDGAALKGDEGLVGVIQLLQLAHRESAGGLEDAVDERGVDNQPQRPRAMEA